MTLRGTLRRLLGRAGDGGDAIRVRAHLKSRACGRWHDFGELGILQSGATLATLIDVADRRGIRLREALETSPHLRHTLMLNGERCPVDDNADRPMADGDEVYLLAPFAGG